MPDLKSRGYTVWDVMKSSFILFKAHDTFTLGAALSYYMIFSIAPVLIIVIALVGAIMGPHAVQGEIKDQLQDILGTKGAYQFESMIKTFYHPGKNLMHAALAVLLLVVGATSVFGQLRTSLNTIWEVRPHAKKPVFKFFLNRFFSFGMIVCLAFLLLVSLVLHAGITAFTEYLNVHFSSMSVWLVKFFHHFLSLGAATILFAFVYKYLSDASLKWIQIWEGALFTAVLFVLGKHLIGLYIGTTNMSDTYGAVGSSVIILAWVFYSSQLVFFGAEFTRALAMHRGFSLDPYAIESHEEAQEKATQMAKPA
jgi:membrane protein